MAQLNEDIVVIKVSQLLRDNEEKKPILNPELVTQLQEVMEQLFLSCFFGIAVLASVGHLV